MSRWEAWWRLEVGYWWGRQQEHLLLWLARRLPRRVRYWAFIVSVAEASTGRWGNTVLPELRAVDVLDRIIH